MSRDRFKKLFRSFAIVGLILSGFSAQLVFSQEVRVWRSADRSESVEATLVGYDSSDRMVTLESTDGRTLNIPLKFFSASDRRYIRSWRKRQPVRPLATDQQEQSTNDDQTRLDRRKAEPVQKTSPTVKAYGIDWMPRMTSALESARGSDDPSDDRPVMWFRVLGDLRGLM